MTAAPFMQLYVGDYLADTLDLTCEEHGAYLLLLMTMWRHDAKLPNDPKKLARIARLSARKWDDVWASISRFFTVEGDSIVNQRLSKEYKKAESKSELRADAGRKGGQSKSLKAKDADVANAIGLTKHSSDIRDQKDSEGKPSDGNAVDFTKEVFDRGVAFLGRYGTTEKVARSLIGKWRKEAGDTETFNALRDANREGVTEPVAWITARIGRRGGNLDLEQAFKDLRSLTQ